MIQSIRSGLLGVITLATATGFADVRASSSPMAIPPERPIHTTLVIDRALATKGGSQFGFSDIVVLTGIHIELEDQFGQISSIAVADDSDTRAAVCRLAGYRPTAHSNLWRYSLSQDGAASVAMQYDVGSSRFRITRGTTGVHQTTCAYEAVEPLPGKKRLPKVEEVTFELSADKIERLFLPTGESYVRIENPRIDLTRQFFDTRIIFFDWDASDQACRIYGYKWSRAVPKVTDTVYGARDAAAYLPAKNGPPAPWLPSARDRHTFKVLTCI